MSLQLRCKCGWTSQVSEFYLGDRVCCPDCGAKLNVHEQSGVPYGYAPYPTWQKKSIPRPVIMPARRTVPMQASDPYAGPAFWMGVFALVFVLTGCGAIPGAILAIFAINSWTKSRSFTRVHGGIQQGYANVGLGMGAFALGISTIMLVVMFADGNLKQRTACTPPQKQTHEELNPAAPH